MKTVLRFSIASLVALLVWAVPARAQNYPTHPITLIVPFAAGGSSSIVARIIAEKMSEQLGQSIVVDNRGGAGGTVGTKSVAASKPDGYTLAVGYTSTLAIAPTMYPSAGYDPRKDLVAIGRIATAPNVIAIHPAFPAKTIPELIAYAKANPGKVDYGSAGVGTLSHVAAEHFAATAGIQLRHIPYKGNGPAITDLLGGHIPMMTAPIPAVHAPATSGLLRVLAVTSATRSALMPDVPTVAEAGGLPGYEAVMRYGLIAPAGTPEPIVARLNKELNIALSSSDVLKQLAIEGAEPTPGTPADYAADIDREEKEWSKVVKALNLVVQ
ncbi:MAG: tripartite tricarboxylate transporter substrate binding protein [Pseudolabrys sp.]|nr:tripartite tricarboxylate transporter substrate binding protein [Pseudolabrys sp.]